MNIDAIDRQLIATLKRQARISYSALAKEVDLTSTAVAQRVQRLQDSGVIKGFETVVDARAMGFYLQAMIKIKLNFARIDAFVKVLTTYDEILFCYRITGEDCLIMKVQLRDNAHLLDLINRLSAYGITTSYMILEKLV